MKEYKVYTISHKKTGEILYVGETGLPLNRRLNCHVAKSKKPGSGKFAGMRDEIEMKVIEIFNTKSEAYKYQCELQEKYGFKTDFQKLQEASINEDGIRRVHTQASNEKRKKTMQELYSNPILVWKKLTGKFIGEFSSMSDVTNQLNVDRRNVHKCLNGIRYKSVSGYIFKYKV